MENTDCKHDNMKHCDTCGKPMCADCGASCSCSGPHGYKGEQQGTPKAM